MRRRTVALAFASLVLGLLPLPRAGAAPAVGDGAKFDPGSGAETVPGEWIVAVEPFAEPDEAALLARSAGGSASQVYRVALKGFLFKGSEQAARRLAEHPRVRKVTANRLVEATAEIEPTGLQRIRADDARAEGLTGEGVTVAVLDSGIDLNHPDLAANLDVGLGTDCVDGGSPEDDNGHGTHVAGIVAAPANGLGVVGVAPDATLVPVKVLDNDANGSFSDIICGVDHVTANAGAIDVVNMSLSGSSDDGESCDDGSMREAICNSVEAGLTYTVSAGNDNIDAGLRSPASYPEVITVSALDDSTDGFAAFSNDGSVVDVIAPGVSILSTYRRDGYRTLSGTSMAAPHVAGAAALVLQSDPGLAPEDVRARLQSTGECPNGTEAGIDLACSGQGKWVGDGDGGSEPLVDALRAATVAPDPASDPSVSLRRPDAGAAVSGDAVIRAVALDAEDPTDQLVVQYRIDERPWAPMRYRPAKDQFRALWPTASAANGDHTVTVRVTDTSGASSVDSVAVTVAN